MRALAVLFIGRWALEQPKIEAPETIDVLLQNELWNIQSRMPNSILHLLAFCLVKEAILLCHYYKEGRPVR